jgi:DNA repair exonuclease SbcCD ATPase subunit
MSDLIAAAEKLAKRKRGAKAYEVVRDWMADFEAEVKEALETARDKVEEVSDAAEPVNELKEALETLEGYSLVRRDLLEQIRDLHAKLENFESENPWEAALGHFEALSSAMDEFEGMLDDPRSYETDQKVGCWDEVTTELGNVADTLKELAPAEVEDA